MNSLQWPQLKELFFELLDLPEAERAKKLAQLQDQVLIAELTSLLVAHQEADQKSFLAQPAATRLTEICLQAGERVGPCLVMRELGRGALAGVYLARDTQLERDVALKFGKLPSAAEARTLASLDHPKIARVYSLLSHGEAQVLCMQYVPGGDLAEALTQKKLNFVNPAARLGFFQDFADLADALEHAHRRGVLHLDIKPANILLDAHGRMLLSDFNVALSLESLQSGEVKGLGGTRNYMAPEHAALLAAPAAERKGLAPRVAAASDVYALAQVLSEIRAALPPFPAQGFANVELELNALLARATHADPQQRTATAAAFAQQLRQVLQRHRVAGALAKQSFFQRWAQQSPYSLLILSVLLPQCFASAVNIFYNKSEIIGHLGPDALATFWRVCAVYNTFSFPSAILLFLFCIRTLRRDVSAATRIPTWVLAATSLGWLPGLVVFPALLGNTAHFIFSFALSWLVALSYSLLFSAYPALHGFYAPRWSGDTAEAHAQLAPLAAWVQRLPLLAGLVPLAGALVALMGAPLSPESLAHYRMLLALLLIAGLVALPLSQRISSALMRDISRFE